MIPLVDLAAQYSGIREEISAAIAEVLESQEFIKGRFVAALERDFTRVHGAHHGIGCSNGTSALSTALEAMGVGRGDEVITTTLTFIATAEAICHVGARPVFVDVDPETYQMDVGALRRALSANTKAIIPVHLYGNTCDMPRIMEIARERGVRVLEDCAQAHFACIAGSYVGTFGDAAAFSFYPGKNLGAYGDAGFIFMKSAQEAETARKLIDHGRLGKYEHELIGYNNRMAGIQAAVLNVKLKYIKDWIERRRVIARRYDDGLRSSGYQVLKPAAGAEPVYHLYPVQVSNREEVMGTLKEKGISSGVHYPIPLHLQPALAHLKYRVGDFPVAERICSRILSLPIYPELADQQVDYIVEEFKKVADV